MSDLINKYPYTDFHAVNLDYILKLVRENEGLHLEESGNQILLKTEDNTIISAITAPYAASAGSANTASSASYASSAGSAASATYATNAGIAAAATNATNAANATKADFATTAGSATSAETATYATTAGSATNATNAVNAQNAAYAETTGNVEHALNAFENLSINGNQFRFTRGNNTYLEITSPYAVKAGRDNLGNIISTTYITNVIEDNGTLKFIDGQGNVLVSITPTTTVADQDSYGNTIADYVKSVSVESGSDYVTIDHGTGTAETLQIPYSDKAWKDTNGNVIKNTYVKRLEIITDPNDGHKKLVAYNGDNPEAELFRIPVEAYRAQVAAEADHAAAADYATSAGSAATAATSTGSVSSISSPSGKKQYLEIANGDGTTTRFNIPLWKIQFSFIEDVAQTNIFDNAFTVGHDEEYEINSSDLAKYGYTEALDLLEEGTYIELLSNGNEVMFNAPIQSNKTSDGGYMIIVLNPYTVSLEAFNVKLGSDDQHIKLTRLL